MTIDSLHTHFLTASGACTDTRNISKNCMFFALRGENFNGNSFAAEALKKGASWAIVDEEAAALDPRTILVGNTLETLQQLATYHRNHCKTKILALTGSNGKTTTKELIQAVLSKKFKTLATQGNLNNHIGVPLTLLSINPETEFAVVEMGANHAKEIEFLCRLAQPDFGYITNFGKAHLEGFGSEQGVVRAKSELYEHLITNKKTIFLNADDPVQLERLGTYPDKVGYSEDKPPYYRIAFKGANPFVALEAEGVPIKTQLLGNYNFSNCCAALLIGSYFKVPMAAMAQALEMYIPRNNRSQVLEKGGHYIIMDAYNANPSSMKAALENFRQLESGSKLAILGDMFELGVSAAEEHQYIADLAAALQLETVFLVGKNFSGTRSHFMKFPTFEELENHLRKHRLSNRTLLIKGSRGMALERILPLL